MKAEVAHDEAFYDADERVRAIFLAMYRAR